MEAALGAGLSAGSLLSTPFLPTSCPQELKSTATHPRGSGGGGPTGCLHGHLRPSLHQVPGAEAAGSPEGREGRGGSTWWLLTSRQHRKPPAKTKGAQWVLTRDWEQEPSYLSSSFFLLPSLLSD